MKQLLKWLGYLVMGSQIFAISLPILSRTIAGYSLKYLLFYLLVFGVSCLWTMKKLSSGKMTITELGVAVLVICPMIIGKAWGWSTRNVLLDTVHMIMPIVIYQWVDLVDIKRENFIKFFSWVSILAGVISVMVALRIIKTDIWSKQGDYVRSAGAVDSTIGIMAVCISLIILYVYPEKTKKDRLRAVAMLISGLITTAFSQSRTRIILVAVGVGFVLLYNIFNRKSKAGSFRLLALVIVGAIIIASRFPDIAEQIFLQISKRFEGTSVDDGNIVHRNLEAAAQMKFLWQSPLVGKGYGSISTQKGMYFHNIYSALLMQGGLLFGGIYIVWMASYLVKAVGRLLRREDQRNAIICLLIMLMLLALGFTNGGILQSSGYCAATYVFLDDKLRKEETVGPSLGYKHANRNPNLSQSN